MERDHIVYYKILEMQSTRNQTVHLNTSLI